MGLSELWAPLFLLLVYPTGRVSLEPRIPERSLRAQLLLGDHPLLTHARVCAHTHTHTLLGSRPRAGPLGRCVRRALLFQGIGASCPHG